MTLLSKHLTWHRPPPVVLGSGRTSLVDKFCATVHALWLETGSGQALSSFCRSVASITTDLGVEFSLPDVQPTAVKYILPTVDHMGSASPELDTSISEGCDLDDLPDDFGQLLPAGDYEVGFDRAMAIPGSSGDQVSVRRSHIFLF